MSQRRGFARLPLIAALGALALAVLTIASVRTVSAPALEGKVARPVPSPIGALVVTKDGRLNEVRLGKMTDRGEWCITTWHGVHAKQHRWEFVEFQRQWDGTIITETVGVRALRGGTFTEIDSRLRW